MKFIQGLFKTDKDIMTHMNNMYPEDEIDKGRGKKDNETKQDIKGRYGKFILDYIGLSIETKFRFNIMMRCIFLMC